jgi:predicted ribosome quality control (RQC) complex YloA/Tae2 family protein
MKFREYILKSGTLVLAGKSAENNEELVSQVQPNEEVFHTSKPGSPFVNIKYEKVSEKDRRETAIFCASKSQDWRDNKSNVEVHYFKGKDISKSKSMKTGTFAVKKFKKILVKKKEMEEFSKNQNIKTEQF